MLGVENRMLGVNCKVNDLLERKMCRGGGCVGTCYMCGLSDGWFG